MKLQLEQLKSHLKQQLAPIYLVGGDEPLLIQEACDSIRCRARELGCNERNVWHMSSGFDWQAWLLSLQNQSLFAERQLIELNMSTAKLGTEGEKNLHSYAGDACSDNVLMIIMGKIEQGIQKKKWFKAITEAGIFIQVWPLMLPQLPSWIQRRMHEKGMRVTPQAVSLLVDRVEGNALACAQEIEKLFLLHGTADIDESMIEEAVVDSTRFDVYALVDAAVGGDAARVSKILVRLRQEGVEPILVLWALARELRVLAQVAECLNQGSSFDVAATHCKLWSKRKPLIKKALTRNRAGQWPMFLKRARLVDDVIKGDLKGNIWDELLKLALMIAGVPLFPVYRNVS